MSFFNSAEYTYPEKTEPVSTLKTMICRKYSLQKQTQFSQVNKVLDGPSFITDFVLSRDTCFLNPAEYTYL
jgi:hypothetical protein